MIVFSLSSCYYNPPDNFKKEFHNYEECLMLAKSIDPDAVVSEEYVNIPINEAWGFVAREWNAVIYGVECHVASVPTLYGNSGIFPGEFPTTYYVPDTDYDFFVIQSIVREKEPLWHLYGDFARIRYDDKFVICIATENSVELSDEELNVVLQSIFEIYSEYIEFNIRKEICFAVPSPCKRDDYIQRNSYTYLVNLTENGKQDFIERYHDAWALLDSDLPICD